MKRRIVICALSTKPSDRAIAETTLAVGLEEAILRNISATKKLADVTSMGRLSVFHAACVRVRHAISLRNFARPEWHE
jgi:hypothetical protein